MTLAGELAAAAAGVVAVATLIGCEHRPPQAIRVDGGWLVPADPDAHSPLDRVACDGLVDDGHIGRYGECFPRGTHLLLAPHAFLFTTRGEAWRPRMAAEVEITPQPDGSWELVVR